MVITFWGLSRNFAVVHQNRKDPMREIQRFANLGHNLCKNDKKKNHAGIKLDYFGPVQKSNPGPLAP